MPRVKRRMAYLIALIVATLFTAGVGIYYWRTRVAVVHHMKTVIQQNPDELENSEELLEQLDRGIIPEGFGIEVPAALQLRIDIADLLAVFWYLWLPLLYALCLTVAFFVSRNQAT
ncbi:MAG: hypothetical protein KDA88_13380 [Planctomycetaceae bacterium]|nr:hypothetical protein [Planctomycetaceae bacterium]MCB9953184.1 hypothetical protein [Planctomycetaceae bacterium]